MYLNDSLDGYKVLDSKLLSFSILKILLHCLLSSIVTIEKSDVSLILVLLFVMCFFPLSFISDILKILYVIYVGVSNSFWHSLGFLIHGASCLFYSRKFCLHDFFQYVLPPCLYF